MRQRFTVSMGSQELDLPVVPVAPELAIALFITTDVAISVIELAGSELADALAALQPEVVVTAATLGIPIGIFVARALGLDHVVALQKTNKIHLADALVEPLNSITTDGSQVLRLDRAIAPRLDGRRVVFVDDVISTGSSAAAGLRLIRRTGGDVVGLGAAFTEGSAWHETLAVDAGNTVALGTLPLFGPGDDEWCPLGTGG
jgi:adenine phosphoribosyltransferase